MTPPSAIYLDCCATTPLLPALAEAIRAAALEFPGNPASQHAAGRRARQRLEGARERIGELLGCDFRGRSPDRVIFTSGGTEANNLALFGLAASVGQVDLQGEAPGRAVISAIEHPSVTAAAAELKRRGWQIDRLPVDARGVVAVASLEAVLNDRTKPRFVSIMLGNNETGVLQPIAELAARCRAAGVRFHTDAVQAVGKLPVSLRALGVDLLSCAAHKFHGPLGIGALLARGGVTLRPQLFGGFQQESLRPGTESVALAVGMEAALELALDELPPRGERLAALQRRFESGLRAAAPNIVIHSAAAPRLPHVTCAAFPGHDRQALVMALDLAGVCCSTGSACASGSSEPSPVLLAMGLPRTLVQSSLRFSWGATTTEAELDAALERIAAVVSRDAQRSATAIV